MSLARLSHGSALAVARESQAKLRTQILNPLEREDWDGFIRRFDLHTVFHRQAWAAVLADTYHQQPVYVCGLEKNSVRGCLPLMHVPDGFFGNRGVSLPFTDLCGTCGSGEVDAGPLFARAVEEGARRGWKYLECRGSTSEWPGAKPSVQFWGHAVPLDKDPASLFSGFSSASRRAVRKAESAAIRIESGTSPQELRSFYKLHCQTRKRHGVPPQPFRFFGNILEQMVAKGQGLIFTAFAKTVPIASAIFLYSEGRAFYKFGASDYSSRQFRPNNFIMWKAIEYFASHGFRELHLGRTSMSNEGLRRFKRELGAEEEVLSYARYDFTKKTFVQTKDQATGWYNRVFRVLPVPVLRLMGTLLYPHMA